MEIVMPKLGFSMNEARIDSWLAEDGATVVEGQPLFAIESDKAVEEIESPASGVLKIHKPADETYEVGTVLGEIS